MKDLLELLGADVVGPAATTAEAERLLSEHAPDVALVDFHLRGGELSYSLIARLHEQGVPVILVSGSSESLSGLPVEAATILEKPVSEAQLLASLRPLLVSPALQRNWLVARHGYRTPAQVRADQRRLDQDAVDDLTVGRLNRLSRVSQNRNRSSAARPRSSGPRSEPRS